MGATVGLILLAVLCASVGSAAGACRHVQNDDMTEYSCEGGQLSDLNDLPHDTGKIRISNMPIPRITADTFSRFGSELWVLGCSNCGIADIEPGAFERLTNLQQLILDSSRLTTIKESSFKGLDFLTYLDLSYNDIQTIEDGVFENLPSLIDLRLSGNRLECLNLEDVAHLTELKRMFLTENPEFKCPNAISSYLDNQGISFEKDPEWTNIPTDLIHVEIPSDYSRQWQTTPVPIPTMPAYRERLHLSSTTPPPEARPYVPTNVYPTEEVVMYHPEQVPPDWTSRTERPTMRPTTPRPPYVPPRTIAPVETMTYPTYPTHDDLETTTFRGSPRMTESSDVMTPQSPLYPPYENQNKHYEQPTYESEVTRTPSLAPSPTDRQGTPSFEEPNMEQTTKQYQVYWNAQEDGSYTASRYPADPRLSGYSVPATEPIHVVRPLPPVPLEIVPPAASEGAYYESPGNSRPPMDYQQRQRGSTLGAMSIETTTDKPFPPCPNRNSSATIARSFEAIIITAILVAMRNVLVEGF